MGFEEDKARTLRQIEMGGGFTSPKTLRAREYLDRLIAAQVAVEQPDSIRAQMLKREPVVSVKPGPQTDLIDDSPSGTHPLYQESYNRTPSSTAVQVMNALLIELTREFVERCNTKGANAEHEYRIVLLDAGMTDTQAQTDFMDSIGFRHLGGV